MPSDSKAMNRNASDVMDCVIRLARLTRCHQKYCTAFSHSEGKLLHILQQHGGKNTRPSDRQTRWQSGRAAVRKKAS